MLFIVFWSKPWLCCHIFVAYQVGKCDNKVNTSFVVTFSLPLERKMWPQVKMLGVAYAYGSLPFISDLGFGWEREGGHLGLPRLMYHDTAKKEHEESSCKWRVWRLGTLTLEGIMQSPAFLSTFSIIYKRKKSATTCPKLPYWGPGTSELRIDLDSITGSYR